jgi:SnoaL-like domain
MSSRAQLEDLGNRFVEWLNAKDGDPEALAKLVSKDTKVAIPYPGSTPDISGIADTIQKVHKASPDFHFILHDTVIDEKTNTIVLWIESTGTMVGYVLYAFELRVGSGLEFREMERSLISMDIRMER